MNRYRSIVEDINWWLFLVVVALLPFPQLLLRYACVAWFVSWVLEGRWLKKPKPLITNRSSIIFLAFGVWYAWKLISYFWAADSVAWAAQMERYMTFALMIPVGLWGVNRNYSVRTIGKVLAVSCVIAVPFYVGLMTLLYKHREIIDTLQWRATWNYGMTDWYTFVSENISCVKHRLFLCSVEMTGVVAALYVWANKKWLCAITIPIMLLSIPLTSSRQMILTAIAILIIAMLYALPKAKRWRYGIAMFLIGAGVGFTLIKHHPRMAPFSIEDIVHVRQLDNNRDVRLNIWGIALQQPADYSAYGLGGGQSRQYMIDHFQQYQYDHYVEQGFHTHNQYLEEWMELGIGGLLLFVLAWLTVPLCARGPGRRTAVFFTTLFMLNMFTDCMFAKFCGIALWAVGLVVILLQSDTEREEQTTGDTQTH